MEKRKETEKKTMIYKTLQRKLKIEQHQPHKIKLKIEQHEPHKIKQGSTNVL
jgi:hypothetical protein